LPGREGEVSEVTIPVWYLRNIVPRGGKANTYLLAHSSECYFGERYGHHSMRVSHKSYFKSELRVRVRRILHLRGEKGSTLVEFGAVAVVLSTLLIGIIYGGITFYDYEVLSYAVAVGARTIATNRGASTNACTLGENALYGAAYNLNQSGITIDQGAGTEVFTGSGGSTCSALKPGDEVTVTATYPCDLYFPRLSINVCSVPQGLITSSSGATNGDTIGNCPSPYAYCVISSTTVRIE